MAIRTRSTFPSGILCSLSAILIPELSREKGADNMKKTAYLTNRVLRQTFSFSVFAAAVFLYFGNEIGLLMSGDTFAGKIIRILAPAVPFIYLEIILAIIPSHPFIILFHCHCDIVHPAC